MNHESWIPIHPTSNIDSQFQIHQTNLFLNSLSLKPLGKKQWIMSHESWFIPPLIFLAEDGHTIAPINPWKFHWDWSSHLWVYKRLATGFHIFWAPDNYAPRFARGLILCIEGTVRGAINFSPIGNLPSPNNAGHSVATLVVSKNLAKW